MSDAAKPDGVPLRDEDLKNVKQISLRSMVATAAAGAAIAAGAASFGASAPQASAAAQRAGVPVPNGVETVDLKDTDLRSQPRSQPMSRYLASGDNCYGMGDVNRPPADTCNSNDDFNSSDPDYIDHHA